MNLKIYCELYNFPNIHEFLKGELLQMFKNENKQGPNQKLEKTRKKSKQKNHLVKKVGPPKLREMTVP